MKTSIFSDWQILSPKSTKEIRRFYKNNDTTAFTACSVIREHIFQIDPEYIWCPKENKESYYNTLGNLIKISKEKSNRTITIGKSTEKTPGILEGFVEERADDEAVVLGTEEKQNGKKDGDKLNPMNRIKNCKNLVKDPEQKLWMKKLMKKALDYYYMFGMCPFKMIIGSDKNPKLVIPSMEEGAFIARINPETSIKEVRWLSNQFGTMRTVKIKPDEKVGVYCWENFEPELDVDPLQTPYTSPIARLIGPYHIYKKFMVNAGIADELASRPPIVTISNEKSRNISELTFDEQLGDAIAFDPENYSLPDAEKDRINQSSLYQTQMLDNITSYRGATGMVRGIPFRDEENVYDYGPNPWIGRTYPLDNGRRTDRIELPRQRTDLHIIQERYESQVSKVLRVPIEIASNSSRGQKTAAESETSNRLFRGAVSSAREAITEFIEEAWAQAMGKFEERIIVEGIESIYFEVEDNPKDRSIVEKYLQGDSLSGKSDENAKENPNVEEKSVSSKMLKKRQEKRYEKGNPTETSNPAERERIVLETEKSAVARGIYDALIKRAEQKGVPVDSELIYKGVSDIVTDNFVNPVQNVNQKYAEKASRQSKKEIIKQQAKEGNVRLTLDDSKSNEETSVEKKKEENKKNLIRSLQQRKRLRIYWNMPPLLDTADIIFLQDRGSIDREVANALIKIQYKIPLDTPSGMSKEERLMMKTAEIKRKEQEFTYTMDKKRQRDAEARQEKEPNDAEEKGEGNKKVKGLPSTKPSDFRVPNVETEDISSIQKKRKSTAPSKAVSVKKPKADSSKETIS